MSSACLQETSNYGTDKNVAFVIILQGPQVSVHLIIYTIISISILLASRVKLKKDERVFYQPIQYREESWKYPDEKLSQTNHYIKRKRYYYKKQNHQNLQTYAK